MAARISTRISIKWADEPASEPTDTLVLSLGGYYVDVRIAKADGSIDWALAGRRIVVSEQPQRVKFTYSINSQDDTAAAAAAASEPVADGDDLAGDVGDFVKLPNGDDFETGEMAAPHLGGAITPYEEVWRQLHPNMEVKDPLFPDSKAWILESVGDDGTTGSHASKSSRTAGKTLLARVGPYFITIRRREVRKDNSNGCNATFVYGAIREDLDPQSGRWIMVYSVGDHSDLWKLSSGKAFRSRSSEASKFAQVGDSLELGDGGEVERFIVRAVSY